jgi:hypothetical protein
MDATAPDMSRAAPNISIIVVTSPVKSHPDTKIIDAVIDSFSLIEGLEACPVFVVFDGFVVAENARTKSGRITAEMAATYEEYYHVMERKYGGEDSRYRMLRSDAHRGFAMSVRWALETCTTDFAVVVQHDRCFCARFSQMDNVISQFDKYPHLRYVGFPSSCSVNHEVSLVKKYGLHSLAESSCYIDVSDDREFVLKPLIFWYDSTHVCHVRRYLEIYRPFRNVPADLKESFGGTLGVKDMILRKGDFIEDRFGQAQRNILHSMNGSADLVKAFQWFGTYILSSTSGVHSAITEDDEPVENQNIFVRHLRGRTFCPIAEQQTNAIKIMIANGEIIGNKKIKADIVSPEMLYADEESAY